jgi:hypothetical protein
MAIWRAWVRADHALKGKQRDRPWAARIIKRRLYGLFPLLKTISKLVA